EASGMPGELCRPRFWLPPFRTWLASIGVTLQAGEAPIMAVGVRCRLLRQAHLGHDPPDDALVSENASVGEKHELPSLRVVVDPPSRGFLVLHVGGHGSSPLILFPHFGVTPRMRQVISVWLCFAERRDVD